MDNNTGISQEERGEKAQPDNVGAQGASQSPLVEARAQQAFELIAGDARLTGSLTDDAARLLLEWSQEEVHRLAAATETLDSPEAADWLAPRIRNLRRRLRRLARRSAGEPSQVKAIEDWLTTEDDPADDLISFSETTEPTAPEAGPER